MQKCLLTVKNSVDSEMSLAGFVVCIFVREQFMSGLRWFVYLFVYAIGYPEINHDSVNELSKTVHERLPLKFDFQKSSFSIFSISFNAIIQSSSVRFQQ